MNSTKVGTILLALASFLLWAMENSAYAVPDAWADYQACCADKRSGIYNDDWYVFFITEIEITDENHGRFLLEGKAMLETGRLMRRYLARGLERIRIQEIPYRGAISERIKQLLDNNQHVATAVRNLPSRVLVKRQVGEIYRYVVAVRTEDIKQQKEGVTTNAVDIDYLIRLIVTLAQNDESYAELATYYIEFGLVENGLYYRNAALSTDYYLTNYFRPQDPYRLYAAQRAVTSAIHDGAPVAPNLLKELPGSFDLLSHLATRISSDDPLGRSVIFLTLLPDTDAESYETALSEFKTQLTRLGVQHANFTEYVGMLGNLSELHSTEDTVFRQTPLLRLVLKTFGHVKMADNLPSDSNKYFEEAHALFTAGREPERIKELLAQSLSESPKHLDSWDHLGALLFWQDRIGEALVAYNQLFQVNSTNLETMAHIANCYYRLGFIGLSQSYAKYLTIFNEAENSPVVKAILNELNG